MALTNEAQRMAFLNDLMAANGITFGGYWRGTDGMAYPATKTVKFPRPSNERKFCIGLEVIRLCIIGGLTGSRKGDRAFEIWHEVMQWAIDTAKKEGVKTDIYQKYSAGRLLFQIAKWFNRGNPVATIAPATRNFAGMDIARWMMSEKVFVLSWTDEYVLVNYELKGDGQGRRRNFDKRVYLHYEKSDLPFNGTSNLKVELNKQRSKYKTSKS